MEIEYLKSGVSNEILSIFVAKLPEIKVEGLKKRWKTWVAKDTINIKKKRINSNIHWTFNFDIQQFWIPLSHKDA